MSEGGIPAAGARAFELEQRLAFLGLTDEDRRLLQGLQPVLEQHADSFVGAFYRHLLSFAPTRNLLKDQGVKDRLLQVQREYLISLGHGVVDADYMEQRLRIGRTHVRVGLEPRWYLGAYALYMRLLIPVIQEHFRQAPATAEATVAALTRLLALDAQLAMEAYIGAREENLVFHTRELEAAGRDLEGRLETSSRELQRTTDRARAAEELASVGTLVAGLAHEIGTPMGVIQGHAELLESSVSDDKARWRLRTIREQIDRISNIIQTLLKMARPDAREHQPLELGALLEDCLAFLGERFARGAIRLEHSLADGARVVGDGEKLQQLFLNLFLNAVDAMPQGGTLSVRLVRRDGVLEVRVADTGPGMAPDVRERVFEPFYSTKPAGQGTGLGLMVARGIVRDHGGAIDVASEPGSGTEFRVVLPAAAA